MSTTTLKRCARCASALVALTVVALANPAQATIYLSDDFSTFTSGDLVGQNGWTQLPTSATLPLQVTGGKVVIPGAIDRRRING